MNIRTLSALTRGWALVAQIMSWLSALDAFSRGWMLGRAWAAAFAELRRAEAVARRLVIALSADLPLPAGHAPQHEGKRSEKRVTVRAYRPGFPLFDPLRHLPGAGMDLTFSARQAGEMPHSTQGLADRLAALQAVLDDPVPMAWRMARFLSRVCAVRFSPLRPGRPPGWQAELSSDQDRLMEAHGAALSILNAARPPPGPVPGRPKTPAS
ncbi:MAG: hypothetical protein MRY64_02870 [Hyphomonadaceae bacterium]|nr:hypothetical protein [Hyphomonadaceae bacterium]